MENIKGSNSTVSENVVFGLLLVTGGILATPLVAGPLVLLGLISTVIMLFRGQKLLHRYDQVTLSARNVLFMSFGSWFLAELISTAANNQNWSNLDYPMRFLLGVGVFWIVRCTIENRYRIFYYGLAASAVAAVILGSYQYFIQDTGRAQGWTNYPIYFGNLSVLLSVYLLIALAKMRSNLTKSWCFVLGIAALLLMSAAFFSGSRSSWLGLAGLLTLVNWRHTNFFKIIGIGFAGMIIVVLGLIYIPGLASTLRINEALQDFQGILGGNYMSSIGHRLQMWKAAWLMFVGSPWVGIGSGNYQTELIRLVESGKVDITLFSEGLMYNQAHSEVMDILATKGFLGAVAYLIMLVMPFRLFRELAFKTNAEAQTMALMGQATIISFFMFGLTLATFKVQVYCAFFPAVIAMLAAMSLNLADKRSK